MASLTVAVNIYVANSSIFADNMCKVSKCYLERQRGLVIESQQQVNQQGQGQVRKQGQQGQGQLGNGSSQGQFRCPHCVYLSTLGELEAVNPASYVVLQGLSSGLVGFLVSLHGEKLFEKNCLFLIYLSTLELQKKSDSTILI